jgi:transposase
MEAISIDLRRRVATELDEGKEAIAAIARRYRVSRRWIYNFIDLREETGDVVPRQYKGGPTPKVTARQFEKIKERIQIKPDVTLDELRRYCRTSASITSVFRVLQKENITRKKRA